MIDIFIKKLRVLDFQTQREIPMSFTIRQKPADGAVVHCFTSRLLFLKYHFAQSLKWQHTVGSFGEVSLFGDTLASSVEEVNFFSHCQFCELRYFM